VFQDDGIPSVLPIKRQTTINEILLEDFIPNLAEYNCPERQIKSFMLENIDFIQRQQSAVKIIELIMQSHEKQILLEYVAELAEIEPRIRELEPWTRDHVVHALLSFVLGVFINKKCAIGVPPFQWKLAGLFHDVGYPLEVAASSLVNPYVQRINKIKRELGSSQPDLSFGTTLEGLTELNNRVNSIDLIQDRLNQWNLEIDARTTYQRMAKEGTTNHGIISSLAVLYVIDLLYQNFNPRRLHKDIFTPGRSVNFNQNFFEGDVVSACSAIFVHNLQSKFFLKKKINRLEAPLAFLLKLSDSLQEWERPSLKNQNGYAAACFSISFGKEGLILQAQIPEDRKKQINDEIQSTLIAPEVKIL
jgi:hypothetical protein